jgi:UDP-N-acetylmuramoylalanine-D-glutamate ligase
MTGSGRGSTLPGKVANLVSASFLHDRAAELPEGFVLVTGTNGKTTTAAMAAHVLRAHGRALIHNVEGANLLSGIASAFAAQGRASLGLLEADEAIVPRAVASLGTPRVVVLTNLFRDQLDRYGEVDRLAEGWLDALGRLEGTVLVANADDPLVAHVAPRRVSRRSTSASIPARRRRRSPTERSATPSSARPAESSSPPHSLAVAVRRLRCRRCDFGRPQRDLEARDPLSPRPG